MEFIFDLGLFLSKAIIIVTAIAVIILIILQAGAGRVPKHRHQLDIEKLSSRVRSFRNQLQRRILDRKQLRQLERAEKKTAKTSQPSENRIFVLDFHGDVKASAVAHLREEITAILSVAQSGDAVVVRLESGGGMVTSYGLAASQLTRIKQRGIPLTICIDKIAASGGYMMACVADRIIAAPFAVVGSIGVIAQIPNFHQVLKRHDIDYREVTAGEFKRTVSIFGEITDQGFDKFKEQIETTHDLFKTFVHTNRPKLDLAKVATGEHWYGSQAIELGLVDELSTSDDYLMRLSENKDVFNIALQTRKKLTERLSESLASAFYVALTRVWTELDRTRFGG
jgi:serine protease SohB